MARPKASLPADRFTSTELAVGAGIAPRSWAILSEVDAAPAPVSGGSGKGAVRLYDSHALACAALIGALAGAGLPLLASARLGLALSEDLAGSYCNLPSRIDRYLDKPINPRFPNYPWESHVGDHAISGYEIFWLHHYLRTRTGIYIPRHSIDDDFRVEIVAGTYVFIHIGETRSANPMFRIESSGRAGDVAISSVPELLSVGLGHADAKRQLAAIEKEFREARENSVAILTVNLSLAIRNALDAVHDHRLAAGFRFNDAERNSEENSQSARKMRR